MLSFMSQNWGTMVIGAVVFAVVVLIVVNLVRDRKRGKPSCGCGCSDCPSAGICHKK